MAYRSASSTSPRPSQQFLRCLPDSSFPAAQCRAELTSGSTFCFKTAEGGIQTIQRHLYGVEWKIVREHFRCVSGSLCPVKPTNRTLPSFFACVECLNSAARSENQVRIVIVNYFVDLPYVQVIGPKTAQQIVPACSWRHLCRGHACKLSSSAPLCRAYPQVPRPSILRSCRRDSPSSYRRS